VGLTGSDRRLHRRRAAEPTNFHATSRKQENKMHWIDPDSLPEIAGTLERFVLNPRGEVDGFVMTGQTQSAILVHTPPHMGPEITSHIKPGDEVAVRGVRPRGVELIAAVAISNPNGRKIVDRGPHDHDEESAHHRKKPDHKKSAVHGKVRLSLFGPIGELRGALLTDGTVIHVGPKEADKVTNLLAPGADLAVAGDALETEHGRVVHAREIGSRPGDLRPVKPEKLKDKKDKHDHEARA
jgi:hypothetical protein